MRLWTGLRALLTLTAFGLAACALALAIHGAPRPDIADALFALATCGAVLFTGELLLGHQERPKPLEGLLTASPDFRKYVPEFHVATAEYAAAQARLLASTARLRDRARRQEASITSDDIGKAIESDLPILSTNALAMSRCLVKIVRSRIQEEPEVRALARTKASITAARKSATVLRKGLGALRVDLGSPTRGQSRVTWGRAYSALLARLQAYDKVVGEAEREFRAAEQAAARRLFWVALRRWRLRFR
jgi:hypothetical protein